MGIRRPAPLVSFFSNPRRPVHDAQPLGLLRLAMPQHLPRKGMPEPRQSLWARTEFGSPSCIRRKKQRKATSANADGITGARLGYPYLNKLNNRQHGKEKRGEKKGTSLPSGLFPETSVESPASRLLGLRPSKETCKAAPLKRPQTNHSRAQTYGHGPQVFST